MVYLELAMQVANTPADYTNSPYPSHNGGFEYVLGYEACRKAAKIALKQNDFDNVLPMVGINETPSSAQNGPELYIEGYNECLKRICSAYTKNT